MNLGETELSLKKLVVSARIASYHVLGSPLTLPVMEDPLAPVLKICFGSPTAESKNLKNHVHFDVGDLFFRSPTLWSSQNVFGPPTAGRVVVDFKDRGIYARTFDC